MLRAQAGADDDRLQAIRSEGGLGRFLRSLLGLDRAAAQAAFAKVMDLGQLSAAQLEFVNLIIEHLSEAGEIDPQLLYEPPFTDRHEQGLSGVFDQDAAQTVVGVIRALNEAAA
jgi:type I restriction enzyme R subunit